MAINRHPTAFPKLDAEQIAALGKFATLRSFRSGEKLFATGERDFKFFILKSGEVEIVDPTSGCDEVLVVHEPGEFTGDVDLLTGRPSLVSAIARGACEAYEIQPADLRRILNDMPWLSDILLRAFLMRRQLLEESGFTGVRVVGSRFSRDTHRIRQFLAKNRVPFTWIDLESDTSVDELLGRFKISADETPVVTCLNGTLVRNPSSGELADCVGVRTPIENTTYDLAVVGAGPAGLAAAVYGASEGLKTLVLDKLGPGGQAGASSRIENYMGFPTGLSGSDLAARAVIQAEKFGAAFSVPAEVTGVRSDNGYHTLSLGDGGEISTKCLLVATGATYRKLSVDGCNRYDGLGVYYAATVVEGQLCSGAQVIVVGDGNAAGQAAVFLSERARRVLLLALTDDLKKTMSYYLARRIEQIPNIQVRYGTQITGMHGDKCLAAVELSSGEARPPEMVECAAVFVFIGSQPHTAWLRNAVQIDERGFVKTGSQVTESWSLRRQPYLLETSSPGIFAAGDVRCGSAKRVASAVGEGAMAVQFMHHYLASN